MTLTAPAVAACKHEGIGVAAEEIGERLKVARPVSAPAR